MSRDNDLLWSVALVALVIALIAFTPRFVHLTNQSRSDVPFVESAYPPHGTLDRHLGQIFLGKMYRNVVHMHDRLAKSTADSRTVSTRADQANYVCAVTNYNEYVRKTIGVSVAKDDGYPTEIALDPTLIGTEQQGASRVR